MSDEKLLMRGNHALAEAAIRAGCRFYFGYPITPQNEVAEYMSANMPRVGGTFVQAESELAAINMVLGASVAGARVMTSSSSPGISLKQEGISFLAGQELPAVIVNIVRGGPGLGNIAPSQSDYYQATRGGGHGDYRTIVLSPCSVQELADQMMDAFDLAEIYRNPVLILGEGLVGQMMEPVVFKPRSDRPLPEKDYVLDGAKGRRSRFSRSLILDTKEMEEHNWKLMRKYGLIEQRETRFESHLTDDAELVVVAFGLAARIAKGAIARLRREGLKIGLYRPITLWPYPSAGLLKLADKVREFMVFELNSGQMIDDVRLALGGKSNIHHYGRPGGPVPTPADLGRVIARRYYQSIGKH